MRVLKKDYPFTVIVEDKKSKAGKDYKSISIGYTTVVDKEAKNVADRYQTSWFNFIEETNLLKLSSLCENIYQAVNNANSGL